MKYTGKVKINKKGSLFEGSKSNQSQIIASSIISQILITKAVNLHIAKPIVFQNCKKDAYKVCDSVVGLLETKPDCSPKRMKSIHDLNPTFFKIKKKAERGCSLRIAPDQYSMKSFTNKNGVSRDSLNVEFASLNSNRKSQRVFPSVSVHQGQKYKKDMFREIGNLQNESEQEAIRILRENKISMKSQYVSTSQKNSPVQRSKFRKKLKENQSKKELGITTDYHGNLVHLLKKQLKRKICHYINMQVSINEDRIRVQRQNEEKQILKKNKILEQQFTNYKELVMTQIDDRFVDNFKKRIVEQQVEYNKVGDKKMGDIQGQNNENEEQDELIRKKCMDFKIIGKTYKPTDVGFNIFYKMKKLDWKIQGQRQNRNEIQEQRQRQIMMDNKMDMNIMRKNNKKDIITTVGSINAMNILFKNDRKYMKKVVTIDSQFL